MDRRRFDALTRALSAAGSRRNALAVMLASLLGLSPLAAGAPAARDRKNKRKRKNRRQGRDRERGVAAEGPCGDGGGPDNRCTKHKHCCTRHCHKKKRRCRCLKEGQPCTQDRLCCPGRTRRTCQDGRCQPVGMPGPTCAETCTGCCDSADACLSGNDREACGSGGRPCQACSASEACAQGACHPVLTPPPNPTPTATPPPTSTD